MLAVALFAFAASHAAMAQSSDVAIEVRRDGRTVVIEAAAMLDADVDTAWRVMTDYGRYSEFVPGVRSNRVVARNGTTVEIEQTGEAALGPLRRPFDVTYEIAEHPPVSLQSRIVAGCDCALESAYVLTPAGAKSRLAYTGRFVGDPGIAWTVEEAFAERSLVRHVRALVSEIERHVAGGTRLQ